MVWNTRGIKVKIGNSLGVRLPKNILTASGIKEGDKINFEFTIGNVKVRTKDK